MSERLSRLRTMREQALAGGGQARIDQQHAKGKLTATTPGGKDEVGHPLDWILVADRQALPWKRLWLVVVYPLVWAAVVLVRGATDGWVPYPFLDPSLGYGSIAVTVLLILVAVIVVAAAVWGFSRLRVIRMGPAAVSAG